jgi:hypothetical protein
VIWGYRRAILSGTVVVLVAYGLFLLMAFILAPSTQRATQAFRLSSEEPDEYPNGAKFHPDDIIAIPVLEEVYATNQLDRFGDFTRFRNGFMVTKSSTQLDMLTSEYRARLAEARLTADDRAKIEADFTKKREQLLREPAYVLTFTRRSRTTEWSRPLLNKVLSDVLVTWARRAEQQKGVLRSKIVFFSRGALREDYFDADEALVGADMLRVRGQRLLESLDSLAEVPGAPAARVGERGVSLADVRARIEDALSLKVRPAFRRLQTDGVAKSRARVRSYFESRLAELSQERDESAKRLVAIRMSLEDYSTEGRGGGENRNRSPVAPAPSDSGQPPPGGPFAPQAAPGASPFFDSLMQLATRKQDSDYRRGLAERMIQESKALSGLQVEVDYYRQALALLAASGAVRQEATPSQQSELEQALGDLEKALDDLSRIYQQLLTRNLAAPALLYSASEPFEAETTNGLSGSRPALVVGLLLVACMVVFPVAAVSHYLFTQPERADS